jgi:hypothetical protein
VRQAFWMVLGTTWSLSWSALAAPVPAAEAPRTANQTVQPASQTAGASQARAAVLGPEEYARRLREASKLLGGSEPASLTEAIASLKEIGGRAAAEAIVARLQAGLPPQLAELALDALAELDQPLATPVLSELTLHRRWQIRQRAVAALGALRVRSTVSVLLFALDDPSEQVRSEAARALGNVGDPRALPALTAALERDVEGALVAIAQVGSSKHVELLLTRAKANLTASEPALWAWLTRSNLPAVSKIKVIQSLDAWNTEEAHNVLAHWQANLHRGEGDARLLTAFRRYSTPAATAAAPGAGGGATSAVDARPEPPGTGRAGVAVGVAPKEKQP